MSRIRATAAAAAVAAAATGAIVAATAGGQAPQGRTITLTELAKGASFGFVDNPPKTRFNREGEPRKLSPGDVEVESVTVADPQGAHVGRAAAYCVLTRPGVVRRHEEECTVSYRLTDGTITVADLFAGSETSDWTAAIVGGTGAYDGARGTLKSVTGSNGSRTDTLQLLP
jgi:hypothetical protein